MGEPRIRANHTKHAIGRIKDLPEPERSLVLDRVEAVRMRVRDASIFDWLPADMHVALSNDVLSVLGRDRAVEFWKGVVLDGFGRALLRPILQGAIAIHGRSPASVLRMAPRAWALVSQDCGELAVEVDPGAQRVVGTLSELPQVFARSPGQLLFFEGGYHAVASHFGAQSTVELDGSGLSRGCARYLVAWE